MVDHQFADADIARLYDIFHPAGQVPDFRFYLPRIMAAGSVLDIGCGTGALLKLARDAGHTGRLCGVDPGAGMLAQARKRSDIEWVFGDLSTVSWVAEFDLIVMSGHAFQVLLTDAEILATLRAVRVALTRDGRFAFETRNPLVRAWERWIPANAVEITDDSGATLRMSHEVALLVGGDLVSFTTTFTTSYWDGPRFSRSTLRFLGVEDLSGLLAEAGLVVVEQYGDWDGAPYTPASPEIITVARRA